MRLQPGRTLKRGIDVVLALVGLLALAPVMAAVALLIRWRLGGPVLFRQRRTGMGGRQFRVLKFRTMTDRRDARGELLPDHRRLTRLGRLLRRLSLDEIPQLINVLRGDMSVVGPRPLLPKYDTWYTATERRRFDVRPGITGLAQIAGRNTVGWGTRLSLDVEYVDRWSLWLDAVIIVRTIRVVFAREGAVADQRALMSDLDEERAEALTDELLLDAEGRKLLRAC
ncbi:sugar transferase [Actinopolymorpha sp. B17G11]|uniref:sugar transferase n=1 Tax=Actinopolymorpha sp. B17G11 TaxID=3160861 RepID=UPI0032E45C81